MSTEQKIFDQMEQRTVQILKQFADAKLEPNLKFAVFTVDYDFRTHYQTFFKTIAYTQEELKSGFPPQYILNEGGKMLFHELEAFENELVRNDSPEGIDDHDFMQWFHKVWIKAGGDQCEIPTYLSFENPTELFDLRSKEIKPSPDLFQEIEEGPITYICLPNS
jgi:hypothetical protein